MLLMDVYEALEAAFGPMNWWPADTPFEVCIGAILTQNAPWTGVARSILNLKERGLFDVRVIAGASEEVLADAVRPSIYYNQKAKRLQLFCRFLLEELGGEVENLKGAGPRRAREMLLSIPGVGFETADSILLYALGMPVFVVDAYTRRIFSRHGLVPPDCGYEELKGFFEEVLEPDVSFFNEFHALICRLGAEVCRKRPKCDACPAREVMGEPTV